jgi:predicted O-methyltransferase YrrM
MTTTDKEYIFTSDWFSHIKQNFEAIAKHNPNLKKIIEIGSYEGRSTTWMLQNLLSEDGTIYCYDTFEGGEEHTEKEIENMYEKFTHNIEIAKRGTQDINIIVGNSFTMMDKRFDDVDFVYIDGSHVAADVMMDICSVFPLVKSGGIILFDDYQWQSGVTRLHHPKAAIDVFLDLFSEQIQVINLPYTYQLAVVKL